MAGNYAASTLKPVSDGGSFGVGGGGSGSGDGCCCSSSSSVLVSWLVSHLVLALAGNYTDSTLMSLSSSSSCCCRG